MEFQRILSRRVLEYAGNGMPRVHFLREVSRLLLEQAGCNTVRVVIKDHGRCYYSEATRTRNDPLQCTVSPIKPPSGDDFQWTTGENHAFEALCRDVVAMSGHSSDYSFTRAGSFWTGDIRKAGLEGLDRFRDSEQPGLRISRQCRSMIILPIDTGQERAGLLQLESSHTDAFQPNLVGSLERLGHTLGMAMQQRRLQVALRERVKELLCLYGIAKLTAQPGASMNDILQGAVKLLPPALLYTDIAAARITVDADTYATPEFARAVHVIDAAVVVDRRTRGRVEVGYIEKRPDLDEGPFLSEERNLIDTFAREVSLIVEQKHAETEKYLLQEQLRHADRLATLGQLAAGVAHELNEPLASILGFSQLSAKESGLVDQTRQDLDRIVNAALHAREVIRKLLVFARETTPMRTELNVSELVEDGLFFLELRCKKAGIELIRNLSPSLPRLVADRSQLMQVLTNLVVNAVQAMPDGGRLTITTSPVGKYVQLTVEDTGSGMTDEVLKKAFNPFFTTKAVDQGTGLGLSVVHGIVSAHGGTVKVESKVGHGTTLIVRLPASPLDETTRKKSG